VINRAEQTSVDSRATEVDTPMLSAIKIFGEFLECGKWNEDGQVATCRA
jgi:hypothetical protein